jgi:holliday junction DNA helicase RuvA
MIARLRGEVIEVGNGRLVVDCAGVGYEVSVPQSLLFMAPLGSRPEIFVRQTVREDEWALYGFETAAQRRMFDLLRDVKGCGPKTSLAALSELGDAGVATAITTQDLRALTRVSGIGPRLAERILVELRDAVQEAELARRAESPGRAAVDDELVAALLALGYRRSDAETAAQTARSQAEDVEGQLKAALRSLSR